MIFHRKLVQLQLIAALEMQITSVPHGQCLQFCKIAPTRPNYFVKFTFINISVSLCDIISTSCAIICMLQHPTSYPAWPVISGWNGLRIVRKMVRQVLFRDRIN